MIKIVDRTRGDVLFDPMKVVSVEVTSYIERVVQIKLVNDNLYVVAEERDCEKIGPLPRVDIVKFWNRICTDGNIYQNYTKF